MVERELIAVADAVPISSLSRLALPRMLPSTVQTARSRRASLERCSSSGTSSSTDWSARRRSESLARTPSHPTPSDPSLLFLTRWYVASLRRQVSELTSARPASQIWTNVFAAAIAIGTALLSNVSGTLWPNLELLLTTPALLWDIILLSAASAIGLIILLNTISCFVRSSPSSLCSRADFRCRELSPRPSS